MTITAISRARNNAELIAEAAELGYLRKDDVVLDPTYGRGRFWTKWAPSELWASDLDPAKSPDGIVVDFTKMPYGDEQFDAVVLDGPYKLNGTSTGKGPSASDEDYGVTEYASWQGRHRLICDGITESVRVLKPRGMLLVKCQDQVCSGAVRWQTRIFADHAESIGCTLVDALLLRGGRKQPEGRTKKCKKCKGSGCQCGSTEPHNCAACDSCAGDGKVLTVQKHASRNYSTLLVFRGPK